MEQRPDHRPSEELLLAHADFLAGLSAQLVRDASDAQDVAQETLLSGLRHAPAGAAQLRAWLSTVARNHALQLFRSRSRRGAREQAVAKPEGLPSTAEIVERENARRAVVEALLELHEPYRVALLLRFYEELPPREVARRLGVPVETARTRIKRGLALLKSALDRRYGDDRERWLGALLPLAQSRPAPLTANWALQSAALGLLGLGALLAGALAVSSGWFDARRDEARDAERAPSLVANSTGSQSAAGTPGASRAAPERREVGATPVPELVERAARAPTEGRSRARGRTLDERGAPLPNAVVTAFAQRPAFVDGRAEGAIARAVSDEFGRFELSGLPPQFHLTARAPALAAEAGLDVVRTEPSELEGLEFVLEREWCTSGLVRDGAGRPLAGARVSAKTVDRRGPGRPAGQPGTVWRERAESVTRSGSDGRFELRGLAPRAQWLDVSLEGFEGDSRGLGSSGVELEFVLAPAEPDEQAESTPTLRGTERAPRREVLVFRGFVRDALDGRALERYTLTARSADGSSPPRSHEFHGDDGSFELGVEDAGEWSFCVKAAGYAPGWIRPASYVEGTAQLELALVPARDVALRVVDRLGQAVRNATVLCEDERGRPVAARVSESYWTNVLPVGADGALRAEGLPAQPLVLRVRLPSCDAVERFELDLRQPLIGEVELRVDDDLCAPLRTVEVALEGADSAQEWRVQVRDARGRLRADFHGVAGELRRPLRCLVQRFDAAGALVGRSLQTLPSDSLSREFGPALLVGAPPRVRFEVPFEVCTLELGSAASELRTLTIPASREPLIQLSVPAPRGAR